MNITDHFFITASISDIIALIIGIIILLAVLVVISIAAISDYLDKRKHNKKPQQP